MREPLSPENPLVRELRDLHRPEGRRRAGAILVEGRRAIDGFLAGGWHADLVLTPADSAAPDDWPESRPVSAKAADRLTQATTASGWFARFRLPEPRPLDRAAGGLVLVEVADPGNVGTLIRSAAAFGHRQVCCIGGADVYGAKSIQASVGGLTQVDLTQLPQGTGPDALAGGAPLTSLVVAGGFSPEDLAPGPRWIVVGSEAHGLDPGWIASCQDRLTLPMRPGLESLNAAVAGSIVCYLLRR